MCVVWCCGVAALGVAPLGLATEDVAALGVILSAYGLQGRG